MKKSVLFLLGSLIFALQAVASDGHEMNALNEELAAMLFQENFPAAKVLLQRGAVASDYSIADHLLLPPFSAEKRELIELCLSNKVKPSLTNIGRAWTQMLYQYLEGTDSLQAIEAKKTIELLFSHKIVPESDQLIHRWPEVPRQPEASYSRLRSITRDYFSVGGSGGGDLAYPDEHILSRGTPQLLAALIDAGYKLSDRRDSFESYANQRRPSWKIVKWLEKAGRSDLAKKLVEEGSIAQRNWIGWPNRFAAKRRGWVFPNKRRYR